MDERAFNTFVQADGERLRRVVVAQYGVDVGCEAVDAALAWAWENWSRLDGMQNPAGYLYRVAQTNATRALRAGRRVTFPSETTLTSEPEGVLSDDALVEGLRELSEAQRIAVLLVHAYGWTAAEVAEFTGSNPVTTRSHIRRGLRSLRKKLNEGDAT